MKLSLAWIFDHIDADWRKQDINRLVEIFNQTTAEIEHVHHIAYDLSPFALARVQSADAKEVKVSVPEWDVQGALSLRDDIQGFSNEQCETHFFIVRRGDSKKDLTWATCKDFNLDKAGHLAAFSANVDELNGKWKDTFEHEDILLEVDNKSITHRPDMWGHRGFAREVAALLDLPFIPQEQLLAQIPVNYSEKATKSTTDNPFTIENKAPAICPRFSGLYINAIENKPADLLMASRLIKVGSRSINLIVDLTNYLMQDWSQPVHAFDAKKIVDQKIIIRTGNGKEKLTLLDEQEITPMEQDLLITNPKQAMALAGVMGGDAHSVGPSTTSIFLESAHFDATSIRRSAFRHKVRTESSARFEKTLDPNQITDAIRRFVFLAQKCELPLHHAAEIVCIGKPFEEKTIAVSHAYFEGRAGFSFSPDDIINPLTKIGFTIKVKKEEYTITIPTYRCAKDVQQPEDLLEEVVRFYGFNRIEPTLPALMKMPADMSAVYKTRKIKAYLAHGAHMTEQQNYAFYDETVLSMLGWDPGKEVVSVANPLSETHTRLITSLMPQILKNIADNVMASDSLSFFELGRVWHTSGDKVIEQKRLSGIVFEKRRVVDFYDGKAIVTGLLEVLGIPASYEKHAKQDYPWSNLSQTAKIVADKKVIGSFGAIAPQILRTLDALPESSAFFFDLDADFLLEYAPGKKAYSTPTRYQEVSFDLSFFIPLTLTVAQVEKTLTGVDALIRHVELIDFFENPSWKDKRALAFRLVLSNPKQTLEKKEIDGVRQQAAKAVEALGASLRSE